MQDFLPLITGGGGALVVLSLWVYAFYRGRIHAHSEFRKLETERDYWRDAYSRQAQATQTERKALNEAASAGQVTNKLIGALAAIATERGGGPAPPAGLAAEDIGL